MNHFWYALHLFCSWLSAKFSSEKGLFRARHAMLHELVKKSISKAAITTKTPAILLGVGEFNRVIAALPRKSKKELANVFVEGKTRSGKGLNVEANCLRWPYPLIANDIKEELWWRCAGFREKGLDGKAYKFDPRGNGHGYDPLDGKTTEFELQSAASTLLYRANEGENQIFTDTAITMLTQMFLAARLEGESPLVFTYKMLNEGFIGAATILEIITRKYNYYPNLATKFLDIDIARADLNSRFLRDCWSTLSRRMSRILTKESVRSFAKSDFTAKDIITSGEHPISVFLNFPEEHLLTLAPLVQLVWDSLLNGMIAYHTSVRGKGCSRVLAVLDEIFRTGLPKLPDYATTVCGKNISLLVTGQSHSQLFAAFGQYKGEVLEEQFDHIVRYRLAPAANRTAHIYEESLGYTSGYAHSKTDHEHGSSEGESEQKIPLMAGYETKLIKDEKAIIQIDGEHSTIAGRLDWRDFPELVQRSQIPPPEIPILPALFEKPPDMREKQPPNPSIRVDPALLHWGIARPV